MSDTRIRRAWAYLARVAEPPCPELADLAERVGPVEAAARIRRGAVSEALARRTAARRDIDCAAQDLELLDRRGGRLVTREDDEWPTLAFTGFTAQNGSGQRASSQPQCTAPLALWVIGPVELDAVTFRSAAIVGTRACTAYGEVVTTDLAGGLAERDVTVVSGGAYGIDGQAHRAALAIGGVTIAVLAGGIDVYYPAGHSALLHRIGEHGLLVTEYAPGTRPARHRFLTRNRLVAALGGAVVVVEAGLRSGAANTAAWARRLGRPVAAVPGPVTSSASSGCHELLRSGAELVTRTEEVVELVGRMGELADEPERPTSPLDGLDAVQSRVYEALPGRGVATVDEVAVGAGLPAEQVLGPLAMLELAGLVERDDGCWRLRCAG